MRELSIFVDESGDFGPYDSHCPYYIVSLVTHDQDNNIDSSINDLESSLSYLGYPNHCLHAGPIIRMEPPYTNVSIFERRKILHTALGFIRRSKVKYKFIYIEKYPTDSFLDISSRISKEISAWIRDNYKELSSYGTIKLYYDNGQIELTKILSTLFNAFFPVVENRQISPRDYRLFQAADIICTLFLVKHKFDTGVMSKSELLFFGDERNLDNNYLKKLKKQSYFSNCHIAIKYSS